MSRHHRILGTVAALAVTIVFIGGGTALAAAKKPAPKKKPTPTTTTVPKVSAKVASIETRMTAACRASVMDPIVEQAIGATVTPTLYGHAPVTLGIGGPKVPGCSATLSLNGANFQIGFYTDATASSFKAAEQAWSGGTPTAPSAACPTPAGPVSIPGLGTTSELIQPCPTTGQAALIVRSKTELYMMSGFVNVGGGGPQEEALVRALIAKFG